MQKVFTVTDMTCSACEAHVQRAALSLAGVQKAEVNLLQNKLTVTFHENLVSVTDIIQAVQEAGYGIFLQEQMQGPLQAAQRELTILKRRLLGCIGWLIALMCVSHLVWFFHKPEVFPFIYVALLEVLLTIPILWLNRLIFKQGFKQLWRKQPTMDSLVAVGAGTSFVYSVCLTVWSVISGQKVALYFESAAMIVTLVLLGKWLETRAKNQTTAAISSLVRLLPAVGVVKKEGVEINKPYTQIEVGDILVVRAGERIAADGFLISDLCSVDESALSGESIPREKTRGSRMHAGTLLVSGYAEIEVRKIGKETVLAQMISLVEKAASSKAPAAKLADRVSAVFVPVVFGISLLTLLGWLWGGESLSFALSCAVAVLVISCPCALGLATPTAIMVGMGHAAKRGILVKNAEVLENARRVDVVAFDKTGTLTTGQMRVANAVPVEGVTKEELICWAATLEKPSQHPFARALEKYAAQQHISLKHVSHFKLTGGLGVRAMCEGVELCGGNAKAMRAWNIVTQHFSSQGSSTVLYFARNHTYIGAVLFADTLKPSAPSAVAYLKRLGKQIYLVTGDNRSAAEFVAQQTGIAQIYAEVLPHEKEKLVRTWQQQSQQVALAGDGINDAAALARANVSISFHTGTDVAAETSDVVLMKDDLNEIGVLLELSGAVVRNIKENLFWAFFYNVLGIPLAAGVFYPVLGWKLSPVFAAAAMSVSSLCVVSNALRLRFFRPKQLQNKETVVMEKKLIIQGMTCGHCAAHVQRALNSLPGVRAQVDLSTRTALVQSAQPVSDEILKQAVQDAGYEVVSIL